MSRLPTVGGDDNSWGDVLNDFLGVEHNADGTQKTLPLTKGGTGSTTAAGARTNLGAEATSNKGIAGGYAPLDGTGKVPAGNLPAGGGSGFAYPASALEVWVDFANGSNSNNGLSPNAAFKTIQAAYTALYNTATSLFGGGFPQGVGIIHLLPGSHDIGNGLVMNDGYPCEIQGFAGGGIGTGTPQFSASIIYSSSSSVVDLIHIGYISGPGNVVTYGAKIQNVSFQANSSVNTSLSSIIHARATDFLEVRDCQAGWADSLQHTGLPVAFVRMGNGGAQSDLAWFDIINNKVLGISLFYCDANAVNVNRWNIQRNKVFYDGPYAMIDSSAANIQDFVGTCAFNNLEGDAIGVHVGGNTKYNLYMQNSGEWNGIGANNPIYKFDAFANQNIVIGGDNFIDGGSSPIVGIFADFDASASGNIVIGNVSLAGVAGHKLKVNDPNHANTYITNGAGVITLPSFTSLPSATAVGPGAMTYDSANGTIAFSDGTNWHRVNHN